jgi:hypothetical protein
MYMFNQVIQVLPTNEYKVYVYFADGKIKLFDASSLVEKGIFKPLKDIDLFIKSCTVINGTLGWDIKGNHDVSECLDLDPDNLYLNSEEVSDPNIRIYN